MFIGSSKHLVNHIYLQLCWTHIMGLSQKIKINWQLLNPQLLKHQPYAKRRPQKKSTPEMVHFSSQKPSQTTGFLGVLNVVPVESLRNTICMWISPFVKITIGHGHEKEVHLLNYNHFLGVQRQYLRRYMHYLGATWAWLRLFLFNGTWHGSSIAANTTWELTQPTNSRIFQDERSFSKQTLKLTVTRVCLWK